jgi:hypothetical protein
MAGRISLTSPGEAHNCHECSATIQAFVARIRQIGLEVVSFPTTQGWHTLNQGVSGCGVEVFLSAYPNPLVHNICCAVRPSIP